MGSSQVEPSTSTQQVNDKTEEKTPSEEAWDDMAEKISVAGWREALTEAIPVIRRMFQISLLFFFVLIIYYSVFILRQWRNHAYKDEIQDVFEKERLPFTNVTICAQVTLNENFIESNITIPKSLLDKYVRRTGMSPKELYKQLAIYLTLLVRPRSFTPALLTFFEEVVRKNLQLKDFSNFIEAAALQCRDLLRKCWFNQQEFDCCEVAARSIDEDGMCFIFPVSDFQR